MTTEINDRHVPANQPLPPYKRRRKRPSADKGLAPDTEIAKLAEAFLTEQRKLWPELAKSQILPEPTPDVIAEMVKDFKLRHRKGRAATTFPPSLLESGVKLAGSYSRFSCDNSSTNSVIDQMVNSLRCAKDHKEFIPWQYVFCDYSVSGLDSARQGYTSYKSVLEDSNHRLQTTYIDDFTRASRDELEWWKLAHTSRRLKKNVIGASDSFNLTSEQGEMLMFLYSLLSKLFIRSLQQKVKRGMKGGHRRRTSLGKLPFGFTRQQLFDDGGRPVRNPDGSPVHVRCIDPENAKHAKRIFELFWIEKKSAPQIAKLFNSERVADWEGWTDGTIKLILRNPAYIGVFVWNKFRRELDLESEKWVRVRNPPKEWERWFDPQLAIISMEWYRGTRRRLSEMRRSSHNTGKKRSRNENTATTLFSGALFCSDCEKGKKEIKLIRSAKKYKQMGCLNGVQGIHKCTLTSSKSVRTIECCLLKHLTEGIFSDAVVDRLLAAANLCIDEEASRPRTDTSAKESELRRKQAKVRNLMADLEDEGHDEDRSDVRKLLRSRINDLQREVNTQKAELNSIAHREAPPPAKLDRDRLLQYLQQIREVLNQSTAASSDAIKGITGPITIHQEKIPGRKTGAKWIATFSPRFLQFLAKFAKDGNYPDSRTLEYLSTRIWTIPESHSVEIYDVPIYEELAAEFREMQQAGMSVQAMATKMEMQWGDTKKCLTFALTGVRPQWKAKGKPKGTNSKKQRYLEISSEVARLHDVERQTFAAIARKLKVSEQTVRRAYDAEHPELVEAARQAGETPKRPNNIRYSKAVLDSVAGMVKAGERNVERIAAETACGEGTVRRVISEMGIKLRSAPEPKAPKKPKVKPETYTADVVRMHDVEGLSFSEIGRRLKICDRTVRKAYDLGRPDIITAAAESGIPPQRSNRSRLSSEANATIHTLIRSGESTTTILKKTGASRTTVNRERHNCAVAMQHSTTSNE